MSPKRLGAVLTLVAALLIAPTAALAGKPANPPGKPATPGAPHAKAYGRYCQNQPKTHVAGQSGTPFSACVAAMKKLDTGSTTDPKAACATLSKKHDAQKGTPYSRCVVAGAQLLKDKTP